MEVDVWGYDYGGTIMEVDVWRYNYGNTIMEVPWRYNYGVNMYGATVRCEIR